MDISADLEAACEPADMYRWTSSLDRYPEWLGIVARAEPIPNSEDPGAGGSGGDSPERAWAVELRARIGPLARSKRLRMVRTVDTERHVRFERREVDGRQHSQWRLDARIDPIERGCRLRMDLHYGGSFGGGLVERLLAEEIRSSKGRLQRLVEAPSSGSSA